MKTLKYTVIAIFAFLLLSLKIGDIKSVYKVPFVNSVTSNDLDLDGDIDLVFGHNYNFITEWGGISFLDNIGNGYYDLLDSVLVYGGQTVIYTTNIIGDENPEIIGQFYDGQQSNAAIIEISNGNYEITYHPLINNLTDFNIGDVSGDNFIDIIFISNNDFLWGIIYNDGTGNFSSPEYFDLTFPPVDIACADLNDDGRDDIVISGSDTEIYFSTETGFQQLVLTTTLSHDVLISDFDNDGDNDVITHTTFVYPNHRVYLFENLGNSQFYEHDYFQFSPFCSYAQIADFNNDTLPDMVFIAHDNSGLHIYQNIGNFQLEFGQFISIENYGAFLNRVSCKDLDGNMYNDIVTIRSWGGNLPSNLNIKFNNGQGGFQENPVTGVINQKPKTKNT